MKKDFRRWSINKNACIWCFLAFPFIPKSDSIAVLYINRYTCVFQIALVALVMKTIPLEVVLEASLKGEKRSLVTGEATRNQTICEWPQCYTLLNAPK